MTSISELPVALMLIFPLTSIVCIVVNGILLRAIATKKEWNSNEMIMLGLTTSDFAFAVSSLISYIPRMMVFIDEDLSYKTYVYMMPIFYYYMYPIVVHSSKVYSALLSIERFIVIYFPIKARSIWTLRKVSIIVSCIMFVLVICSTPKAFQLKVVTSNVSNNHSVGQSVSVGYTELGLAHIDDFEKYNIGYQFAFGTVPIVIVLVLNVATAIGLRNQIKNLVLKRHSAPVTEKRARSHKADDNPASSSGSYEQSSNEQQEGYIQQNPGRTEFPQVIQESKSGNKLVDVTNTRYTSDKIQTVSSGVLNAGVSPFSGNLKESDKSHNAQITKSSSDSTTLKLRKVTITMIIIANIFLLCNLPGVVVTIMNIKTTSVVRPFSETNKTFFKIITTYLSLLNSAANSLIFIMRSGKYKNIVRNMFGCCRNCQ